MKKVLIFVFRLIKSSKEIDLVSAANELTYKLILALFPFIIFLMSLIGFFNLDVSNVLLELKGVLPDSIYNYISVFIHEVVDIKNPGILSLSLIITIFSASSGFNSIIKSINKAYGYRDTRNFFKVRLLSVLLVFIFALSIILSILTLVFGDSILEFLNDKFVISDTAKYLYSFFGNFIVLFILLSAIILIYKLSNCENIKFYKLIPGAIATLFIWILASKIFNIYINNFSRFSKAYGSVASVFILMYWLNIISIILLVGAKINALLDEKF